MRSGILRKLRRVKRPRNRIPRALKLATKMLRDSVTATNPASRTGSHPVIKVKIAEELKRRPRAGLPQLLMAEGRKAFCDGEYEVAVVKFLAVEALVAKYGEILIPDLEATQEELAFLKIQFFLKGGQMEYAWEALKSRSYKGSSYLWHRRYSARYHLNEAYWDQLCSQLSDELEEDRCAKLFGLLGYALVMSRAPYRADDIKLAFGYKPAPGDDIFAPFLRYHESLVSHISTSMAGWLSQDLAETHHVTPLSLIGDVLYIGTPTDLSRETLEKLGSETGLEIVSIPVTGRIVKVRNSKIYEEY